jgi:predicted small lipoprotein YifL
MKRYLGIFIAFILLVSVASCGVDKGAPSQPEAEVQISDAATQAVTTEGAETDDTLAPPATATSLAALAAAARQWAWAGNYSTPPTTGVEGDTILPETESELLGEAAPCDITLLAAYN